VYDMRRGGTLRDGVFDEAFFLSSQLGRDLYNGFHQEGSACIDSIWIYPRAVVCGLKDGCIVVHLQAMQYVRNKTTSLYHDFPDARLCIAQEQKCANFLSITFQVSGTTTKINHWRFLSTFLALLSTSSPYPLLATSLHRHQR
jgi:hypothetical protein